MYDLKDDLLVNVNAIAKYVNKTPRQVYYLLEHGFLPAYKLGGLWQARRSTINNHIEQLEAATIREASDGTAS